MANAVQMLTPTLTNSTTSEEHRNAEEKTNAKRAQMNAYLAKPIDPEFAAVDKWCDSALKLSTQAERLESEEVKFIQAREILDRRGREIVTAHELGVKLLLDVVHALKGITEDDLSLRLQNLLDQVSHAPPNHPSAVPEFKIKPFKDEAIHIRQEISFRESQKAQILELTNKLETAEDEKRKLHLVIEKTKKDNKRLKDLLRAKARASMKLFERLKNLEGRYEWLTKYTNTLVGITKEAVLAGDDLEEERKLLRMAKGLEGR